MTYAFNPQVPPLLKDGEILNIDPNTLQRFMATAYPAQSSWTYDSQRDHYQYLVNYRIDRYQRWVLVPLTHHYTIDTPTVLHVASGYSQTDRTAMEKSLSATAGAAGYGLSVSVTADLKLTTETVESWHVDTDVTTNVTYLANTTYASWVLYEVLELTVSQAMQYEWGSHDPGGYGPFVVLPANAASLHVAVFQYDDHMVDPDASHAAALFAHNMRSLSR